MIHAYHYLSYWLISISTCLLMTLPLQAEWTGWLDDIAVEARVAYYHPSSHKVRRIYGDGWADYQLELSKGIGCNWRVWAGVSGFSRKGDSIGCHDETKLRLIPVSLGVKYDYPLWCDLHVFAGAAACYSFLHIHDHSCYVHEHTRKQNWGALIQTGLRYDFCGCFFTSLFADYFFQQFHFHDSHQSSCESSSSRYIERSNLNMNGYKIGVGLGVKF